MLARVARWEGGDAAALESSADDIRSQVESGEGPPPGVPAKGFLLLQDPAAGKATAVMFFENEDDYREGDQTLNEMNPPGGGMGQRVSVEKFEVVVQAET